MVSNIFVERAQPPRVNNVKSRDNPAFYLKHFVFSKAATLNKSASLENIVFD